MDYITNGLISLVIPKDFAIGVQNLHLLEVSVTNTDNDPAKGHARKRYKLSLRLFHIMAVTISDDDHDVVLAIAIEASLCHRCHNLVFYLLEEISEVAGAGQSRLLDTRLVGFEDFHGAFAARIVRSVEAPQATNLILVADVVRDAAEAIDVEAAIILGILAHHVAHFEEGFLI